MTKFRVVSSLTAIAVLIIAVSATLGYQQNSACMTVGNNSDGITTCAQGINADGTCDGQGEGNCNSNNSSFGCGVRQEDPDGLGQSLCVFNDPNSGNNYPNCKPTTQPYTCGSQVTQSCSWHTAPSPGYCADSGRSGNPVGNGNVPCHVVTCSNPY